MLSIPTSYECVPFGSEYVIVDVVELLKKPSRVTDHEVPDGSPTSLNVTGRSGAVVEITSTLSEPTFVTWTYPLLLSYATPRGPFPTAIVPMTVVPLITLTSFEKVFAT